MQPSSVENNPQYATTYIQGPCKQQQLRAETSSGSYMNITKKTDVQTGAQQHTQQRRAREQPDTTWREDDRPQVHCTDTQMERRKQNSPHVIAQGHNFQNTLEFCRNYKCYRKSFNSKKSAKFPVKYNERFKY